MDYLSCMSKIVIITGGSEGIGFATAQKFCNLNYKVLIASRNEAKLALAKAEILQSYSKAATWFRLSAKQGDSEAQYRLGMMYEQGDGVEKDLEKAVKLYRFAADQGHAMAQVNLGWMYINGHGVEEDLDEAAKWYRRSDESRKTKSYQMEGAFTSLR